jgi:hypothetical protein
LFAPTVEERIGRDNKGAGVQLEEGCKSGVDLGLGASL